MVHVFRRDPFRSFLEDEEEDFRTMTRLGKLTDPFGVMKLEPFSFKDRKQFGNGFRKDYFDDMSLKRRGVCPFDSHQEVSTVSTVSSPSKNSRFEVNLNLNKSYQPGELTVTLSKDHRTVVIEGRREESKNSDCGYSSKVSSEMHQKIRLPDDVDVDGLKCELNENGVMVISAPRVVPALEGGKENVKSIPVNVTGRTGERKATDTDPEKPSAVGSGKATSTTEKGKEHFIKINF